MFPFFLMDPTTMPITTSPSKFDEIFLFKNRFEIIKMTTVSHSHQKDLEKDYQVTTCLPFSLLVYLLSDKFSSESKIFIRLTNVMCIINCYAGYAFRDHAFASQQHTKLIILKKQRRGIAIAQISPLYFFA